MSEVTEERAPAESKRRKSKARELPIDIARSGSVPIRCQFCVGHSFQRSRLRAKDIKQILLMRYPVRCVRCRQRQYVSFTVAGLSLPARVRHHHHTQHS